MFLLKKFTLSTQHTSNYSNLVKLNANIAIRYEKTVKMLDETANALWRFGRFNGERVDDTNQFDGRFSDNIFFRWFVCDGQNGDGTFTS